MQHYFERNWLRILLSLLILGLFLAHVTQHKEFELITRLENIAYDARLLATMPRTHDDRIVIIDIDEKSLAAQGRWPWPRDVMADLVNRMFDEYEVELLAFDIVFAEKEESTGIQVLAELEQAGLGRHPELAQRAAQLQTELDHDRIFADSIKDRKVVLGFFFTGADESGVAPAAGELPRPTFVKGQFTGRNIDFNEGAGYGANLAILQDNAYAAGHFLSEPDTDGIHRRVPMIYEYDGNYYESLSLAVARTALGVDRLVPGFPADSVPGGRYSHMEWLELGPIHIPVDKKVRTLVPYRGPQGSFPYYSATDVLHGRVDKSLLMGKIVLVGTTAKGLLDLRATPVAPDFPGVEVHANLISGILSKKGDPNRSVILENPAYMQGAELLLLLLCGLVMSFLLPALSPIMAAVTTLVLLTTLVGTNMAFWFGDRLVVPLAASLLAVLTLFLFNMSYGFLVEARGKRQLASQFGQYVPPELVEEMSENPDVISMESQNRELTVLFSDVRGFTTISEGLNPRELSQLMNEYLTPMTRVIHHYRGTIDKYMGDAIMAFWGAPLPDDDHARHALEASLAMLEELKAIGDRFEARGWPRIHIGIGLNTGNMSVGNMGSEFRRAYTVMGDAVNLGSRLEGLTKNYGIELVVSETTAMAVPEYVYREIDRVRVKGKEEPVTIYEPMCKRKEITRAERSELKLYREALKLYRAQNWDSAEIQFLNLHRANPTRELYRLYAERVAIYRQDPPGAGWDGVFTYQTK
ncbi:MAG: adenylate/guanylate cyclase domain-containing protein [Gammaproteobacteria bacterium]|nr:adenylate/guanylate cyclase domain-containing protein [Gammaproteobacteria bacterium]